MAEVHSFKKRHLISCGNDVLAENSEGLRKQLQEEITFLRQQLKNKDEVIDSLLQQLVKRDSVVIEYNNVSSHETSDEIHCFLTIKKYRSRTKYHPWRTLIGQINYCQWDRQYRCCDRKQ